MSFWCAAKSAAHWCSAVADHQAYASAAAPADPACVTPGGETFDAIYAGAAASAVLRRDLSSLHVCEHEDAVVGFLFNPGGVNTQWANPAMSTALEALEHSPVRDSLLASLGGAMPAIERAMGGAPHGVIAASLAWDLQNWLALHGACFEPERFAAEWAANISVLMDVVRGVAPGGAWLGWQAPHKPRGSPGDSGWTTDCGNNQPALLNAAFAAASAAGFDWVDTLRAAQSPHDYLDFYHIAGPRCTIFVDDIVERTQAHRDAAR